MAELLRSKCFAKEDRAMTELPWEDALLERKLGALFAKSLRRH